MAVKQNGVLATFTPTVSKYTNELYANAFESSYGYKSIGLRYFNVFGKRQNPESAYAAVISRWLNSIINNKQITIYGDGETTRDFTHVDDVVQGILQLLADPNSPSVAHFGSGSPRSISSIADCFDHPIVHSFDRRGEAERTFCQNPYVEPTHNVHEYIKQWVMENKSDKDGTKNSS